MAQIWGKSEDVSGVVRSLRHACRRVSALIVFNSKGCGARASSTMPCRGGPICSVYLMFQLALVATQTTTGLSKK